MEASRAKATIILIGLFVIGIVMPVPRIVKGENVLYVAGTVTIDGSTEHANGWDVRLRNLETNESIYTVTNETGHYIFELEDFENGCEDGDYLEILVQNPNYFTKGVYVEYAPSYMAGNTINADVVAYPLPAFGTWCFQVMDLNVVNRQSKYSVYYMCANGDHYLPEGDAFVELRAGYSYYDCAKNVPNGKTYSVRIYYYFEITLGLYPWLEQEDSATLQYTISPGEEKQSDPYLSITLDSDYNNKQLSFHGCPVTSKY